MKKLVIIPILLVFVLLFSCKEKKTDIAQKQGIYQTTQQSSCVACHTNKDLLEQVAEPLEGGGESSGEG